MTPLGDLLVPDRAVMNMVRKWRLQRPDGSLRCIWDHCDGDGQLPTLECASCRAERKRTGRIHQETPVSGPSWGGRGWRRAEEG